jgi:hypothetical protein
MPAPQHLPPADQAVRSQWAVCYTGMGHHTQRSALWMAVVVIGVYPWAFKARQRTPMDQQQIEICKKRLKEARAREYETFTVAVTALGEPMKARQRALHAQIEYEKAKWGNPDSDFKKVYDETVSLSGMQGGNYCDRAIRECIKPPLKYVLLGWPGGPVIHDNPFL